MMKISGLSLRARPSALDAVVDEDVGDSLLATSVHVWLFAISHGQLPKFADIGRTFEGFLDQGKCGGWGETEHILNKP